MTASTRLLVPGLTAIVVAEIAALWYGPGGFIWLTAALVAGFSLSGSV
ncbi:hypothetical protein AB0395_05650 [Streptosporangium sp. NPDC051023]